MKARNLILIGVILLIVYYLTRPMARSGNEAFISKMSPSVRGNVRDFLKDLEALGYTPKIRDSTRTFEEQEYYKRINPKNASPGSSRHERGTAIDIDIYKDGKVLSKKTLKSVWIASGVPALANDHGLKWGGNFSNYADNNHFYF